MTSKNQQATGSNEPMMTRKRLKIKEQLANDKKQQVIDKKRRKMLFQSSKVIGPRDIPVDLSTGKIRIVNEELDVKPKVELEDGGNLGEPPVDLLMEEGVRVVKEEVEVPMDTAEEELGGTSNEFENLNDNEMNLEEPQVEVASAVAVEPEVREDYEGAMKDSGNTLEENLLLKRRLEEKEARIGMLEELQEKDGLEKESLKNEVQLLRQKNYELEGRIKALELEKITMVHDVEAAGEPSPLQKLCNISVNSSMMQNNGDDPVNAQESGIVSNSTLSNEENSTEPGVDKVISWFPKVIGVMWKKYGVPKDDEEDDDEEEELSMLRKTDYLNLRLVCSAWKEAIDELETTEKTITVFQGNFSWAHGDQYESLKSLDYDRSFLQHTNVVLSPPTKLRIRDDLEDTTRRQRASGRNNIENLLGTPFIGQNIKDFIYYRDRDRDSLHRSDEDLDWAPFFVRWLELMPNLTSIDIKIKVKFCKSLGTFYTDYNDRDIKLPSGFPTLVKVKHLNDGNWPVQLFLAALRANPQITSLAWWKGWNKDVNEVVSLPNLKELCCDMSRLSHLTAPILEHLVLHCTNRYYSRFDYYCVAPQFHQALEKFSHSLQTLEVTFGHYLDLDFPKMLELRKLVLIGTEGVTPTILIRPKYLLELVSSWPSLEHLVLDQFIGCNCKGKRCPCCSQKKNVDKDAVRNCMETEWVCKLWEAIPKLCKVEVKQPSYYSAGLAYQFVREKNSD